MNELAPRARAIFRHAVGKSRRSPYINSKCRIFKTDKIFLNLFWAHLNQKGAKERIRRIKLYQCALDTMQHSRILPEHKLSTDRKVVLYRFYGITKGGEEYCVQVKEELKTGRKYFMSVFPLK